jgi:hypothetical protein
VTYNRDKKATIRSFIMTSPSSFTSTTRAARETIATYGPPVAKAGKQVLESAATVASVASKAVKTYGPGIVSAAKETAQIFGKAAKTVVGDKTKKEAITAFTEIDDGSMIGPDGSRITRLDLHQILYSDKDHQY